VLNDEGPANQMKISNVFPPTTTGVMEKTVAVVLVNGMSMDDLWNQMIEVEVN
jgi:hypothetical protein